MASCSTGRPVESCVWNYFRYVEADRKTICIVNKSGTECDHSLNGNFMTNLKLHLNKFHAKEYTLFEHEEKNRKQDREKEQG